MKDWKETSALTNEEKIALSNFSKQIKETFLDENELLFAQNSPKKLAREEAKAFGDKLDQKGKIIILILCNLIHSNYLLIVILEFVIIIFKNPIEIKPKEKSKRK